MSTNLVNKITVSHFFQGKDEKNPSIFMVRETQISILSSVLIKKIEDPLSSYLSSSN